MTLYHITEKRKVDSILKNGLLPKVGKRSKNIESVPIICLTELEYLDVWKILLHLNQPAVLEIRLPEIEHDDIVSGLVENFDNVNYDGYKEIRTNAKIEPDCISLVKIPNDRKHKRNTMRMLCQNYIDSFSYVCTCCARHYADGVRKYTTQEDIEGMLQSIYSILSHLNFSVLSTPEKRKYLKNFGESGEFTFLDTYLKSGKKLYQLSMYDDDRTYDIRCKLEDLIRKNFADCLDICTGGWIDVQ